MNINSLVKLREFEDSCLQLSARGQVIVRKPTNDNHKPAKSWQVTQSYYYMPLITEAFYRAIKQIVPQEILDMSGRITLLHHKNNNFVILKYYSDKGYEELVQKIIVYLEIPCNLDKLKRYYKADEAPSGDSAGHIYGDKQVEILEGAEIVFIVETMIRIHFNQFN